MISRTTPWRITLALSLSLFMGLSSFAAEQEQTWKINLKNADIREFVSQISGITGRSFVVDPRVKGKVTVISNAALDAEGIYQLYLSVLRVHNYTSVPAGTVEKVVQQTLAKQSGSPLSDRDQRIGEMMVTRVVPVVNTSSTELAKILRPLMPQYSHIAAVTSPNSIILSDHAENITRLLSIIAEVDLSDTDEIKVINLKEAWVGTMVELLEKLAPEQLSKGAKGPTKIKIVASERTNSLIIKGDARSLVKMEELVTLLDKPSANLGSIQVLRLAHADATKVAEIIKGLLNETTVAGSKDSPANRFSIQADESLNALVIKAEPGLMGDIKSIVSELDVRRVQVLIEAAIVEVTQIDMKNIGVDFAVADAGGSSTPLLVQPLGGAIGSVAGALASAQSSSSTTGGVTTTTPGNILTGLGGISSPTLAGGKITADGINFAFVIQAVMDSTNANLLSTPSILTLDNQQAKIVVGSNVPFRTGSTTTGSDGTTNPFTTIERQDVGLTLEVTPHINAGDVVRLEVNQEVSSVIQNDIGANAASDIITDKRTIQTTILADNGQTIVLGGLIRDDITETETKIPLLGDLPLLGQLFRSNGRTHEKRNLLVFLRPTILRNTKDTAAITERQYTGVWEVEIEGAAKPQSIETLFRGRP